MARSNRKKKSRLGSMIIWGIILVILCTSGVFLHITNNLSLVALPAQKTIYQTVVHLQELRKSITDYREIVEENNLLKHENALLDIMTDYNERLTAENIRLKELLEIKHTSTGKFKIGRVNFRSPNNLYNVFYIDLGEDDGVTKNCVVFSRRALIGKVREVYKDYAMVDMITSEKFAISVITDQNVVGILRGSASGLGDIYFEPNSYQNSINLGDKIYTSGISDIYPKGLYIGTISMISENSTELFKQVRATSGADLLNLEDVLVLLPPEENKTTENNAQENNVQSTN